MGAMAMHRDQLTVELDTVRSHSRDRGGGRPEHALGAARAS